MTRKERHTSAPLNCFLYPCGAVAGWSVNPQCFQWTEGIANKTIIGAHAPQGSTATAVRLSLSRQFITLIYNAVAKATKVYFIKLKKNGKKRVGS